MHYDDFLLTKLVTLDIILALFDGSVMRGGAVMLTHMTLCCGFVSRALTTVFWPHLLIKFQKEHFAKLTRGGHLITLQKVQKTHGN